MSANSYSQLKSQYESLYTYHHKRYIRYSLLRGLVFILMTVLVIWYFRSANELLLPLVTGLGGVFYFLVLRYRKHDDEQQLAKTLIQINEEEINRQRLHLADFDGGEIHEEDGHPFTADLDVFGKHSLYQLLNRTNLPDSGDLLATWMKNPASAETIKDRQETIRSLSHSLNWLQHFLAISRRSIHKRKKNQPNLSAHQLTSWVNLPNRYSSYHSFLLILAGVLITCTLGCGVAILFELIPYQVIYLPIALNVVVLGVILRPFTAQTKGISEARYFVGTYQALMEHTERLAVKDGRISVMVKQLKDEGALKAIQQLDAITARVDSRTNIFYLLLDCMFILDLFLLIRLEKWKYRFQNRLVHWLEIVHELEVYASLAAHAIANADDSYPSLTDKWLIDTKEIAHPLMLKSEAVPNDYHIAGGGHVDVVTGSNMSGKSTFERTLGTNIVLGTLGLPVRAKSMTFKPLQIFTSMRTRDNLSESTSSFYAELKRLRQLLSMLDNGANVFFMLDEILKGTNSEDRHKGAVGLIKRLVTTNAMGLVSTHDLELAQLAKNQPKVRNLSFNSTIEGSEIRFDYQLTPGPCKSFNAAQLMKNMGILE